jgi:hypothetical protein
MTSQNRPYTTEEKAQAFYDLVFADSVAKTFPHESFLQKEVRAAYVSVFTQGTSNRKSSVNTMSADILQLIENHTGRDLSKSHLPQAMAMQAEAAIKNDKLPPAAEKIILDRRAQKEKNTPNITLFVGDSVSLRQEETLNITTNATRNVAHLHTHNPVIHIGTTPKEVAKNASTQKTSWFRRNLGHIVTCTFTALTALVSVLSIKSDAKENAEQILLNSNKQTEQFNKRLDVTDANVRTVGDGLSNQVNDLSAQVNQVQGDLKNAIRQQGNRMVGNNNRGTNIILRKIDANGQPVLDSVPQPQPR